MRPSGSLAALFVAFAAGASAAAADPSRTPVLAVWVVDNESGKATVAGSGFLIGASGHILTARHVAEHNQYETLAVSIGSKSANRMPVLADARCSVEYDFCVLRILSEDVVAARLGPPDFYRVSCRQLESEDILAYGFLPGNNGISSARGTTTTGVIDEGLVLTSAPFEPTMSGGPVFDKADNVVAIVNGGARQQSAILPLAGAASALLDSGYDCRNPGGGQAAADPQADALRKSEIADLKALSRTVSTALQEKSIRLIPALDAYVARPGQGTWSAVVAAARTDTGRVDAAITSVVEFLARYQSGGSAEVEQLLDSALGAAPVLAERPETGALQEMAVALAGKSGIVMEILEEPTPPSPDKAARYRVEITSFFKEIDKEMRSLIRAYTDWLQSA